MLFYLICFLFLVCFGFLGSKQLPVIYESVKINVLKQNKILESEKVNVNSNIGIAIIFSLSSLLFYYLTSDVKVSVFIFIFSCVAYTDLITRWVPDVLIYTMVWVGVFGMNQPFQDGMLSIILFCFPAVVLYSMYYIKHRQGCIASGDWYLFPTIGIWISPEYAALIMVISIGIAIMVSRFIRSVPFLTCIFPVFIGGQLCEIYII